MRVAAHYADTHPDSRRRSHVNPFRPFSGVRSSGNVFPSSLNRQIREMQRRASRVKGAVMASVGQKHRYTAGIRRKIDHPARLWVSSSVVMTLARNTQDPRPFGNEHRVLADKPKPRPLRDGASRVAGRYRQRTGIFPVRATMIADSRVKLLLKRLVITL